jgi:hydroxyacid-oxoacid transhydrogenase
MFISISIIYKYFRRAVLDADDIDARTQMLLASSMAGMGFGNAGMIC